MLRRSPEGPAVPPFFRSAEGPLATARSSPDRPSLRQKPIWEEDHARARPHARRPRPAAAILTPPRAVGPTRSSLPTYIRYGLGAQHILRLTQQLCSGARCMLGPAKKETTLQVRVVLLAFIFRLHRPCRHVSRRICSCRPRICADTSRFVLRLTRVRKWILADSCGERSSDIAAG